MGTTTSVDYIYSPCATRMYESRTNDETIATRTHVHRAHNDPIHIPTEFIGASAKTVVVGKADKARGSLSWSQDSEQVPADGFQLENGQALKHWTTNYVIFLYRVHEPNAADIIDVISDDTPT